MKVTFRPKVKICCISSVEEAKMALGAGADALGLVSAMPSGPGVISENDIYHIVQSLPMDTDTFLLTSKTEADDIIVQHERLSTRTIQIVDKIEKESYQKIRQLRPEVKIVQVIHVLGEDTIQEALHVASLVDYILLDIGNPNLKIKKLGGTGEVHNWDISRRIREKVEVPVFLAGGLNADNVQDAIRTVRPYGIDLCSGVRTDGKLDVEKLKLFFEAVGSVNN